MPVLEHEKQTTKTGRDLAASAVLHLVVIGGLVTSGFLFKHKSESWGDQSLQASSIQATAVPAIPLPPKQQTEESSVLATENPSPAPPQTKEKVEEAPSPKDIPILEKKPEKKPKEVVKPQPPQPVVQHPQPVKPQPDRAASGEAPSVRMAMTTATNNAGTSAVAFTDAGFGTRFAYYARQMAQKTEQQWYTGLLNPNSYGHKVAISFRVDRDGTPSDIRIEKASGDPLLDQSGLRALQRIDSFGPLPQEYTGSYLVVHYTFEPKAAH